MPESVLTLLKLCLVAVLYLFFFRVLRAVWAEVRHPEPPAPAPMPPPQPARAPARPQAPPRARAPAAPSQPRARPGRLRVVRPPPLSGTSFQLADGEATLGRAPGCSVLLDDPTVSSRHARLSPSGGRLLVEDLGSRNGTLLNGQRLDGPTELSVGDRLLVGPNVELEVLA
ncbi:MAG: FHA domain-containing protein [Acidimicrobiales bacterium]